MSDSVEARGSSVEEAIERALAELGVPAEDAVVEVLSEGRRSLFGAPRRAHVRVSVREGSGQGPPQGVGEAVHEGIEGEREEDIVTDTDTPAEPDQQVDVMGTDAVHTSEEISLSPEERMDQLDEEAELAADFVEGLLDLLDLPGDIEIEVQEDQALVSIQDLESGLLIGRRGATLDALQELVRCAVQRQTERRSHVRVDVEGYRARQVDKLRDKCREAIAEVRETGEPVRLEPMDAYERKMMHDLVTRTGGVTSSSEGNEPKRRVVIFPAD
jgi:spoIIIJ-associated protein